MNAEWHTLRGQNAASALRVRRKGTTGHLAYIIQQCYPTLDKQLDQFRQGELIK